MDLPLSVSGPQQRIPCSDDTRTRCAGLSLGAYGDAGVAQPINELTSRHRSRSPQDRRQCVNGSFQQCVRQPEGEPSTAVLGDEAMTNQFDHPVNVGGGQHVQGATHGPRSNDRARRADRVVERIGVETFAAGADAQPGR